MVGSLDGSEDGNSESEGAALIDGAPLGATLMLGLADGAYSLM